MPHPTYQKICTELRKIKTLYTDVAITSLTMLMSNEYSLHTFKFYCSIYVCKLLAYFLTLLQHLSFHNEYFFVLITAFWFTYYCILAYIAPFMFTYCYIHLTFIMSLSFYKCIFSTLITAFFVDMIWNNFSFAAAFMLYICNLYYRIFIFNLYYSICLFCFRFVNVWIT